MTTNIILTELETKLVGNMVTNNYGDIPDHNIWSWAWDEGVHGAFCTKAQISGVIASLVKKGLIRSEGEGDDANIWFTEEGVQFLYESGIGYREVDGKFVPGPNTPRK